MRQQSPQLPPLVMTFAASDPTCGAGIQADIMTLASMGCHPLSVITALTVQDTAGVEDVLAIDADWVSDQARALLEDVNVAAFKLGMLGSVENIMAIAEILADYPDIPLVFDPVLASGRGDQFADEDMVDAMIELLLPQTTIITPNSLEARRLTLDEGQEEPEDGEEESQERTTLIECARRLIVAGSEFVLITGTHENTEQVVNTLYGSHGVVRSDKWERLPGSYHGSGCTLASAIAANLANGLEIAEAVKDAQEYTWQALAAGFRPGMGQHLPDRFFWARDDAEDDASRGS
ncbi:MAG: hydroxymethylpyrimidine/phosphomethylpyrimidine kinase [Sterolibacterium sp.]